MKNIIISLIVIAVVVFGGYYLMKDDKKVDESKKEEGTMVSDKVSTSKDFSIDSEKSKVTWKGSFVSGLKSHTGTIAVSGSGIFEDGNIGSVVLMFDMNSIKDIDGSAKLEEHLKSDDFFNSAMYPQAKVELTGLSTTTTAEKYNAKVNLTIRDITKEVTFPVMIKIAGDTINAYGKVTFNRADFNVKYGSKSFFKNLGDKVIADQIELDVNIFTKPIGALKNPSSI